jgi:hypothetical protein
MPNRCGHPTPSGPCERRIAPDVNRCFMHDESGPPRSHGAPLGNDNAEGNPGGGAPSGNFNAGTHGAWSDWRKHYDRLVGDAKEYVDDLTNACIEKSKADLPDDIREEKARELATRYHLCDLAAVYVFEEGWGVEHEVEFGDQTVTVLKVNPALSAEFRHKRRQRDLRRELRVYPSPDGRPWTERSDSPADWMYEDGEWSQ